MRGRKPWINLFRQDFADHTANGRIRGPDAFKSPRTARLNLRYFRACPALAARLPLLATSAFAFLFTGLTPSATQTAVANGDTRTISLIHVHTKEQISATFRVNGQYDSSVLEKLNWFLRDWRRDEPTKMDPHLFDIVWEAYRESGSREPVVVMSAYRSPETNAMLRRRSRAVAEHSQHILGKAMDMHYTDVPMSRIREIGMRMQKGGVGYYPTAGSPFVHMDAGSVRSWPRMGYDQLARLFPDGKTVHIPANGQPMARYEEARAEIAATGSAYVPVSSIGKSKGFFATLFGGGDDDEGAAPVSSQKGRRQIAAAGKTGATIMVADNSVNSDSGRGFFVQEAQRVASLASSNAPAPRQFPSRNARPAPAAAVIAAEPVIAVAQPPKPQPEILVAAAPVPVPVAEIRPQIAASPPPRVEPAVLADEPAFATAALPLPPRRPSALLATYAAADVPLPPSRPIQVAAATPTSKSADALGLLIAANPVATAALPDVILRGVTGAAKPAPLEALGYAELPVGTIAPARPVVGVKSAPAAVVAALVRPVSVKADAPSPKADRTNLRGLTAAVPATQMPSPSVVGVAAPALRSARRAPATSYFADPMPGVAGRFEMAASALLSDRFVLP